MNEIVKYDPQESLTLQKVSEGLFASGLFPNTKNKYGAFSIVQYGRELGIPPMMSLRNINIISGQLACNAQLMLTLAMQKGVTYEVLKEGDKGASIRFKRGAHAYEASFTEDDAKAANLLGKDNWRKYPRDMYFWRCVAKGVRRIAPDAVMGLYTAEEITEGAVISVAEVSPDKPVSTVAENVVEAEQVVDPPPAPPTDGKGAASRKALEARIGEMGIDRETFKEWLDTIGWLQINDDGRRSMKDLSDSHVKYLLDKWDSATAKFNAWVDKMNAAPTE